MGGLPAYPAPQVVQNDRRGGRQSERATCVQGVTYCRPDFDPCGLQRRDRRPAVRGGTAETPIW